MPVFAMDEYPPTVGAILAKAASDCASFESGEFSYTAQAVVERDVTGDDLPETVIDSSHFACSTAASLWGGTGGTQLWVVVDDTPLEFLAHQWQVVDMAGQPVLLLAVHSSECGSDRVGPCYRALVWSDGFRTTR